MRILRIKLQNLNSLRGDHEILIDSEPFASAGLFAITGPTGAGKSTLLDAITLALFGRSARYEKSNPEDMMSRHCGECAAEVTFSVPKGIFRAAWHMRRARGKADGNIRPASRYVYDADGNVLAQKVNDTNALIEELIGLDYDRFLRSVMLAQGEFARFLKANPNERAALLESLTGTIIYSELSLLAHTEATRRENELEAQKLKLGQISILENEQRSEIEKQVDTAAKEKEILEATIKENADTVKKIDDFETALTQKKEVVEKQETLAEARVTAETDLKRLAKHRETIPFQDDLVRLEGAESNVKNLKAKLKTAESGNIKANRAFQKAALIYKTVLVNEIKEKELLIQEKQAIFERATQTSIEAKKWLDEHVVDANLTDQLTDFATSLTELKGHRKSLEGVRADLLEIFGMLEQDDTKDFPESFEDIAIENLNSILDIINRKFEQKRVKADAFRQLAAKELKLRRDHLEKAKIVADMETHRAMLVKGEACPLCGALDHPYVEGQEPTFAFEELDEEVVRAESELDARRSLVDDIDNAINDMEEKRTTVIAQMNDWTMLKVDLSERLKGFDLDLPEKGKEDKTRKTLQAREKEFQKYLKTHEDAESEIENACEEKERATSWLVEWHPRLDQLDELNFDDDMEIADDVELPPISQAAEDLSDKKAIAGTKKAELENRQNDTETAQAEYDSISEKLVSALKTSHFQNLDELFQARLANEEVSRIAEIEEGLKIQESELKTRLQVVDELIGRLRETNVPEEEAAIQFKQQYGECLTQRDKLIQDLTTWDNQLKEDKTKRDQLAEQKQALAESEKELEVWRRLRSLIGSHDGSRFRRYAQSISLDILVRHANKHLLHLSDRYRIKRNMGEELQLEIEDMHQASVTRPMASLSGGESFLASLALALGLSDLAGRNVRIESLFIDEGFGSLDSETLDLAIGTLESLRQENKSIGVISHVELLKQRITTQIVVEKKAGGISTLRFVS